MIYGTMIQNGKEIRVSAAEGETLRSVLLRAGAYVSSPCGGNGTCGKCRVRASGMLVGEGDGETWLACRTKVIGTFTVEAGTPHALGAQTAYQSVPYTVSPAVRSQRTATEARFYLGDTVISTDRPDARNLGLAVDIGTTTAAVYLCDMDRGTVIGSRGFANPQRVWGADVISRVDKIMKDPAALAAQQKCIIDAINEAARALLPEGTAMGEIRAAVFCGNTVMQHIAAGLDPSGIAVAPFTPKTLFGEWYDAGAIGLEAAAGARIYFAPCVASYVGGDILCGVIATGLDHTEKNVIYLDIGTNGEIGLATKDGLRFCSAAAGPAFEGAHIACGMPGMAGAVSAICREGETIRFETVGGGEPVGICGSGILDGVAVMLDAGLLDETGCIDEDADSLYILEDEEGDACFSLHEHVYLTGRDIREVQLAKAAIAAGIRTLLHEASLEAREIDALVLAGGFGAHIRPESACRIGLIPEIPPDKIVSVGNTAGAGAVMLLLGREPREVAERILARSQYTELSLNAFFMEAYIEEMEF
ncbi:MAG: DUF4445 domain-containing protein [Clostridia bacterium]|nr:DUF4445 domain-containing protein [Clostridia bacterium]